MTRPQLDASERLIVIDEHIVDLRKQIGGGEWREAIQTARFLRGILSQLEAACELKREAAQWNKRA